MFNVGDKVVYPRRGCGIIEAIEPRTMLDKEQEYIIIRIYDANMTIMLPCDMCAKSNFRHLSDVETVQLALEILNSKESLSPQTIPSKQRFKDNMTKLASGSLPEYAEIVRDLSHIHKIKPLNSGERNILVSAKKFLVDELSLIKECPSNEVTDFIDTMLA